ncbi:hypothetical protein Q8A67_013847 [Cirrhinus molitorella]|uniref:Uncharacterized protein n=1 Tax=Cirrhinus molitorella TaxID=172907 RepID=A0AA88TJJ5_9TELE|nr:hypothetical protein Q8A67_013847 [Cirrhinus molitorella]
MKNKSKSAVVQLYERTHMFIAVKSGNRGVACARSEISEQSQDCACTQLSSGQRELATRNARGGAWRAQEPTPFMLFDQSWESQWPMRTCEGVLGFVDCGYERVDRCYTQ